MPPCFGSAASAAPETASKANIAMADARTLNMLLSLWFGLVPVGVPWPIGRDHSHRGRTEQPAKPLAALVIWMKYLRRGRDKMRRRGPHPPKVARRQQRSFAVLLSGANLRKGNRLLLQRTSDLFSNMNGCGSGLSLSLPSSMVGSRRADFKIGARGR